MKKLPEVFLSSLQGVKGFDRESFEQVHAAGEQVTSVRINPAKASVGELPFPVSASVPWTKYGYYLEQRPSFTFDPVFHAGCYYVQEASSMFLEQVLKQHAGLERPLRVLDLCAAPGGKSTHIQSLISADSLLVANEVIKSRALVLADNIIKWGAANVIITNNDPSAFKRLEGYFDVIVADAPCSGSGLFRRDEEAINEWSLNNVQLCCQRQRRLLADVLPSLKENGLLVYSTCSYSKEEDEDIADWLTREMEMENLQLELDPSWNIISSHSPSTGSAGYRFYPDKLRGEGFFISCFKKPSAAKEFRARTFRPEKVSSKERMAIAPLLPDTGLELLKEHDRIFALPPALLPAYSALRPVLNLHYAGIGLGQVMKEKLVPEHPLAMSGQLSEEVPANELDYEQAIRYLQRQELNFNSSQKGWQLVRYQGHNLGWINVLPNRINNYYPKEIRILKQSNDSSFEK